MSNLKESLKLLTIFVVFAFVVLLAIDIVHNNKVLAPSPKLTTSSPSPLLSGTAAAPSSGQNSFQGQAVNPQVPSNSNQASASQPSSNSSPCNYCDAGYGRVCPMSESYSCMQCEGSAQNDLLCRQVEPTN